MAIGTRGAWVLVATIALCACNDETSSTGGQGSGGAAQGGSSAAGSSAAGSNAGGSSAAGSSAAGSSAGGSSAGGGSAESVCSQTCQKAAEAMCPSQPAVADCVAGCTSVHALATGCEAEISAYDDCLIAAPAFECVGQKAAVPACDDKKSAWSTCMSK